MTINKQAESFGMPWEKECGYSQAVKVDNTIYVSGKWAMTIRAISSVLETMRCRCVKPMQT